MATQGSDCGLHVARDFASSRMGDHVRTLYATSRCCGTCSLPSQRPGGLWISMITKDNSELFRELNQSILEVLTHIAIQCKFINSPSFSSGRGHRHQHISLPQSPEGSFIPPLSPYPPPFPLSLLPSPPYPQANFNLPIYCCPSNPTCCGHSHSPLPWLSHSGSSTPVRKGSS